MNGRWLAIGGLAAMLLAPLAILWLVPQAEFGQSICPHKLLTGFPCPGCGLTRSLMTLYRGDLVGSFAYHALGPLVALAGIVGIAALAVELGTRRDLLRPILFNRRLAYALGSCLAGYHVVRLWQFVATHDVDAILRESIWR